MVIIGRHWPLSSNLGRPGDGPTLAPSDDGRHFDMTRLHLSRRQSATMAGAPTDHARLCPLHPNRPQSRCQCRRPERATTADPRRRCLSHQLGKLVRFGLVCPADLRLRETALWRTTTRCPGVPRGSPLDPARVWHGPLRPDVSAGWSSSHGRDPRQHTHPNHGAGQEAASRILFAPTRIATTRVAEQMFTTSLSA